MGDVIGGLDHAIILVESLDEAAKAWSRLGFTVTPLGHHSHHLGTANHRIMFASDYLELVGVLRETEHNRSSCEFLARRGEGIDRVALETTDVIAGLAVLRARGIEGVGPTTFERTLDFPERGTQTARFQGFWWPLDQAPGDVRLRACQHLTPELVWQPVLARHSNTANRIVQIELVSRDPRSEAEQLSRLLDRRLEPDDYGAWRVPSGSGRAAFVFLDRAALGRRHPKLQVDSAPDRGAASLVVGVADLQVAAATVRVPHILGEAAIDIGAEFANGVILTLAAQRP